MASTRIQDKSRTSGQLATECGPIEPEICGTDSPDADGLDGAALRTVRRTRPCGARLPGPTSEPNASVSPRSKMTGAPRAGPSAAAPHEARAADIMNAAPAQRGGAPAIQFLIQSVRKESGDFSRLSEKEAELFRLVNQYRMVSGLPLIENSRALNKVARIHAIDLVENRPAEGVDSRGLDCSLHSWSKNGPWSPVCYTKDHVYATAMWDKPREITKSGYPGDGYENAYATAEAEVTPARVLEAWRASPSHNALLIESGPWAGARPQAFGIGIYRNVAVIWFGSVADPLGPLPMK